MPSASDELKASTSSIPGWCASSRCLTGSLHIAPDEITMARELRSHLPGCSSSAARRGRENGSPTMTNPFTLSLWMVSSISTGSYRRDASRHTRPPSARIVLAVKAAGPVHERAGRHQRHAARARLEGGAHPIQTAVDVVVAHTAVDEPGEEVVLAPHDALGHPGRAAGVEHVEVVAAASPRRAHPADGGLGGVLVGGGPVGAGPAAVVDPEPALHARHTVEDALDALGERAVEHDRHRVGVVPEIRELVVAVAVVRVDRHEPDLHGAERGLDVLGAVVEVDRDLVLLRHAEIEQELRHPVGPAVEVGPRHVAPTLGRRRRPRVGRRPPSPTRPRSSSQSWSTPFPRPSPVSLLHPRPSRHPAPPPPPATRQDA